MQTNQISYCKKEIMSVCTADTDTRQKECSFYEKSCRADKCMYFVFDEYCDNVKAQLHAQVAANSVANGMDSPPAETAHWL